MNSYTQPPSTPSTGRRFPAFASLLTLVFVFAVHTAGLAGARKPLAQTAADSESLKHAEHETPAGEESFTCYGGGAYVPEWTEFRRVAPFLANWRLAMTPSRNGISPNIRVAVNTMLGKELETKDRMDLKGWVKSLVIHAGSVFEVVDPPLTKEELPYAVSDKHYQGLQAVPSMIVEAEIACYDQDVLTKQSGLRVDLLFGDNTWAVNPSMRKEKLLNHSIIMVQARVKWFQDGRFEPGASAIVAATLATRSKDINLGLFVRGSGIGVRKQVGVNPGLQQAILRCTSRAVMIAMSRAIGAPYWHVLPDYAEDEVVKESLRAQLSQMSPEQNAMIKLQTQDVLTNPFREPVRYHRQDVMAIVKQVTDDSFPPTPTLSRDVPPLRPGEVMVECIGFPPLHRSQLTSALDQEMRTFLVSISGDWVFAGVPKRNLAKAEQRRKWGESLASSIPRITGRPCKVVELSPTRFQLIDASSW